MADRYYVNCSLGPGMIALEGPEAHHLAAVCRVRPGDAVSLFNGDGHEYPARVHATHKRHVELEVLGVESPERELGFHFEVAAPLAKGDRAGFLIEKLTELGVTRFVPLRTERTVVHPGDGKLDKLERRVIEASKQCGRNRLMEIAPLAPWAGYCVQSDLPRRRLLAHPSAPAAFAERTSAREDIALAVGPEGGFTDQEVEQARDAGWQVVGLGPRVLRVETAAIALAVWAASPATAVGGSGSSPAR
jgi:16S rRNA (uracil1498-N3)-methyltransferase